MHDALSAAAPSPTPLSRSAQHLALAASALTLALLAGCANPPTQGAPGQIISRLPASAPGATPAAPELTQAEKDRYQQIDKQVMEQQTARSRAQAWANAVAATPVYYGGYNYYTPYPYQPYPAFYPAYPAYTVYPGGYYGYGAAW